MLSRLGDDAEERRPDRTPCARRQALSVRSCRRPAPCWRNSMRSTSPSSRTRSPTPAPPGATPTRSTVSRSIRPARSARQPDRSKSPRQAAGRGRPPPHRRGEGGAQAGAGHGARGPSEARFSTARANAPGSLVGVPVRAWRAPEGAQAQRVFTTRGDPGPTRADPRSGRAPSDHRRPAQHKGKHQFTGVIAVGLLQAACTWELQTPTTACRTSTSTSSPRRRGTSGSMTMAPRRRPRRAAGPRR